VLSVDFELELSAALPYLNCKGFENLQVLDLTTEKEQMMKRNDLINNGMIISVTETRVAVQCKIPMLSPCKNISSTNERKNPSLRQLNLMAA
jgi:hypothetical protein